jgi:hypothetical protein
MKPKTAYLIAAAIIVATLCMGCTLSMGTNGKPAVGMDGAAIVDALRAWQASKSSKDSDVQIIWEK